MSILLSIILSVLFGAIGFVIVWIGMLKQGTGAYQCGSCDYSFVGLKSEQCPECGAPTTKAVQVQQPCIALGPRIALLCAGTFFLLLAAFFALVTLANIWISHILGIKT